ncbi:MAG: hypothetical protein K8I27_12715 [Planctomycetes bacterium]|nr:hypothetical protein [Planctomycetota bacterium]
MSQALTMPQSPSPLPTVVVRQKRDASPTTVCHWRFASNELTEAGPTATSSGVTAATSPCPPNKSGNYYSGGTYDPDTGAAFQVGKGKEGSDSEDGTSTEPWGDLTETQPDPETKKPCDFDNVRLDGTFGQQGQQGKLGWQWEQQGAQVNDENANVGKGLGRRSWNLDKGDISLHLKIIVKIKDKNEDPKKWITCTMTCKAWGNYTYIASRKAGKQGKPATLIWGQGTDLEKASYFDDKGNTVKRGKLGDDEKVEDDEWVTYHRYPCKNGTYDIYESMRKGALSRIWNTKTQQFEKTDHGTMYQCEVDCEGTNFKPNKLRAYHPTLPHAGPKGSPKWSTTDDGTLK